MRRVMFGAAMLLVWSGAMACGPKVDCAALNKKLDTCAESLVWSLKAKAKENFDKNPSDEAKQKLAATVAVLRKKLKAEVYEPCRKNHGKAKDAKQVNACLAKKSCDDFAACFVKYLTVRKKQK
ncbi:MAG: hypothetical protein J7M25_00275 [Deltaproteobacteria bacterium]|nr:hypothetical protein [Deltaproteobacteria bacterium]